MWREIIGEFARGFQQSLENQRRIAITNQRQVVLQDFMEFLQEILTSEQIWQVNRWIDEHSTN
jgi:hypothetical protein